MPVPKKRTSKARRDKRRSHDFLKAANAIVCPECGESVLRHRACAGCGTYRGRKLLNIDSEL